MPTRKKPVAADPYSVDPGYFFQLEDIHRHSNGTTGGYLMIPDIPVEQIEAVGHACALAVLAVLQWPDDKAAMMAAAIRDDLAEQKAEQLARLDKLEATREQIDPDNEMPF